MSEPGPSPKEVRQMLKRRITGRLQITVEELGLMDESELVLLRMLIDEELKLRGLL